MQLNILDNTSPSYNNHMINSIPLSKIASFPNNNPHALLNDNPHPYYLYPSSPINNNIKSNYYQFRKISPQIPNQFQFNNALVKDMPRVIQSNQMLFYLAKVYIIMFNGNKGNSCDSAINANDGNAFHSIYIKQKSTKTRALELIDIPMASSCHILCSTINDIINFISLLYPLKNSQKLWKVAILNEHMSLIVDEIQLYHSLKKYKNRILYAKVRLIKDKINERSKSNYNEKDKDKENKISKCSLHSKSKTFYLSNSKINPSSNKKKENDNNPLKNQELQIKEIMSTEIMSNQLNTDSTINGRFNTFNNHYKYDDCYKTSLHYNKQMFMDESKQYLSEIDSDKISEGNDFSNINIQTHRNIDTYHHSHKKIKSYVYLRNNQISNNFNHTEENQCIKSNKHHYLHTEPLHNNNNNQMERFNTNNLFFIKPRKIRDIKSAKCPSYFDQYVYSTKTNHKLISKGNFRYVKNYLHRQYKGIESSTNNLLSPTQESLQFKPHSIKEEIANPKLLYLNAISEFRIFFKTTFEKMIKQEDLDMIDCLTCNYIFFNDLEFFPINQIKKEFLFWAIFSKHIEKYYKELTQAFLANEIDLQLRTSWKRTTYKRNTRHRDTSTSHNNPIEDNHLNTEEQNNTKRNVSYHYKKIKSLSKSRRSVLLSNRNFTKMIQELYFIMKKMTQDIRPFLNTFQFEEKHFGISFFLFIFFLSSDDYFILDEEITYRIFTELNIDSSIMTFQQFVEYYIHIKYGVNLTVQKKFVFAKKVIPRIWVTDYRSDDPFSQKLKDSFGINDFVVKLLPNMNESQIKKNKIMIEKVYYNMVKYFYPEGFIDYKIIAHRKFY